MLCVAVVTASAAAPALAIDVAVETWTGEAHRGQWLGVADGAARIETRDGDTQTLSLDALMSAAFDVREPAKTDAASQTIYLADGTVLFGKIVGASGDAIEADCRWTGRVSLPIKRLAAIRFLPPAGSPPLESAFAELLADRPADRDVLIAAAGDTAKTARGVLESISDASVNFQWNDQSLNVSHDRCYAVVLARGIDRPAPARAIVRLRDGAILAGEIVDGDNATLFIGTPYADRIELPLRESSTIAWHSASVTFASAIEPAGYQFTPYIYGEWPWRANRSVMNTPIMLDGQSHERGVGMRCGGALTFETAGQFAAFAATIGIDDAVRPRGEVIFRVLADEREVFNSGPVTGMEPARRISADIGGAKQVTLVVDVGGKTDVGGCGDWADARFIKGAVQ